MSSVKIEPYFGGFVLETLTIGMYGESKNAIREYIQNGFDSILKARGLKLLEPTAGTIELEMAEGGDYLIIRDNGAGLPFSNAVDTLISVGASTKDPSSSAGFRGIGRLAGIGFSDTLTFRTKSAGEAIETTVVFNGHLMRELMSPKQGSSVSAEQLLRKCVTATQEPSSLIDKHFFEVKLEGFVEAPDECKNVKLMREFVSQVSPVGYHESFPYKAKLLEAAKKTGIPIEEIILTLKDGDGDPQNITKVYRDKYLLESGYVELSECDIRLSQDNVSWWGWIGRKIQPGSYDDSSVSGLRVRMKNIQIDGTEVVRDIFKKRAKSSIRFQDWWVGEIFVRPSHLVPNARRDGFEDTKAWKEMRIELTEIIKELDSDSHSISDAKQVSFEKITEKVKGKIDELERLRKAEFKNVDKIIALSSDITKLQKTVVTASKNASLSTLAELQVISSELSDIKAEAISKISGAISVDFDAESIRQEACDELLLEIISLFEKNLAPNCFNSVRSLIRENYGVGT